MRAKRRLFRLCFSWWAVQVSNLRPHACELCRYRSALCARVSERPSCLGFDDSDVCLVLVCIEEFRLAHLQYISNSFSPAT